MPTRRLLWLPLLVMVVLGGSVPNALAARQRKSVNTGKRVKSGKSGKRTTPRTALQRRMAEEAKLTLNPYRRAKSELANGPIRTRLSRTGGSSEDFTVSDRVFVFRGQVRETSDGSLSLRVRETYRKTGKRGRKLVPTENPWE